jgi:Transcription factor WhiB
MDLSALITRGFAMSDRMLWLLMMERGACSISELSPDDWYPVSASAEAARCEAAGAIAVCAACRVRDECLELALRNWAVGQHGVWGGTVPAERERLRAARVTQLTRVLARNRYADLAASRSADRAASLSPLRGQMLQTDDGLAPTVVSPWGEIRGFALEEWLRAVICRLANQPSSAAKTVETPRSARGSAPPHQRRERAGSGPKQAPRSSALQMRASQPPCGTLAEIPRLRHLADIAAVHASGASAGGFSRRPMMWTSTPYAPASWITCRRIGPLSVMCHPLRWIEPMTI